MHRMTIAILAAPLLLFSACAEEDVAFGNQNDKSDTVRERLVELSVDNAPTYHCDNGIANSICFNPFTDKIERRLPGTFETATEVTGYNQATGWISARGQDNRVVVPAERDVEIKNVVGANEWDKASSYVFRLQVRELDGEDWTSVGGLRSFYTTVAVNASAGSATVLGRVLCERGDGWCEVDYGTLTFPAVAPGALVEYQIAPIPLANPGDFDIRSYQIAFDID